MVLVFDPDVFTLGISVGVLGLVLLLSLVVAYAYDERTLLFLAAYLVLIVVGLLVGQRWYSGASWMQSLLLVAGPAMVDIFLAWLLKKRTNTVTDQAVFVGLLLADLGLLGFITASGLGWAQSAGTTLAPVICLAWGTVLLSGSVYRAFQAIDTVGPWKWWLMLGHGAGLAVALLFLADIADAQQTYWPVVLMLLVQVPPVYLSLVWRSRLLNEARLRSGAAAVVDPLTGLATSTVLIERLMRIMARAQHIKAHQTANALFLIEVKNWDGLLAELGADFNEKLLLEAAMRLRRSVGDNDMVARVPGGRFAVVAQGLVSQSDIAALATRLVVSGLRIDSPLLPGVELQFRVIVLNLKLSAPLSLPIAHAWLEKLTSRFQAWPSSHRSRSILMLEQDDDLIERLETDSNY